MKPYVEQKCRYNCKYDGKTPGKRSRDAQQLFKDINEGAKENPKKFAAGLLETKCFGPPMERNGVEISAYVYGHDKLMLQCTNGKCQLRGDFGMCKVESAILPSNVSKAAEKAWRKSNQA